MSACDDLPESFLREIIAALFINAVNSSKNQGIG
jgi:hypothetical protein